MNLEYCTLDVFTDRCFGGNPLAVVLDARGLDDATMQSISLRVQLQRDDLCLAAIESCSYRARAHLHTRGRTALCGPSDRRNGIRAGDARPPRRRYSRHRVRGGRGSGCGAYRTQRDRHHGALHADRGAGPGTARSDRRMQHGGGHAGTEKGSGGCQRPKYGPAACRIWWFRWSMSAHCSPRGST